VARTRCRSIKKTKEKREEKEEQDAGGRRGESETVKRNWGVKKRFVENEAVRIEDRGKRECRKRKGEHKETAWGNAAEQ
jgi:hypothetical protein